jgi:hypothetical protein
LPASEALEWSAKLHAQPAENWNGTVQYAGWRDVPSVYIVCKKDAAIPEPLQLQLASMAGSQVEVLDVGHME